MKIKSKYLYWILPILLLFSCNEISQQQREYVDSLNMLAYNIRYSDIDSTRNIAQKAFNLADDYAEGKARALNLLVYVDYQQMNFAKAFHKLDSVNLITNNQIILLVSDVLRMKINQRIGDGLAFFESRVNAQKRMRRAEEEYDRLNEVDRHDYNYARTEYHIISSTYYYYQELQQQAIEEMEVIADDFALVNDSTQWLYYNYMMGSGGLIEGSLEDVTLREFDHLMICWGFSRSLHACYFEANSLQALATMLAKEQERDIVCQQRADLYRLLLNQHLEWLPQDSLEQESYLPEALALHAVYGFRQYKDLFQTACAYRTLGEMAFNRGLYELALENYDMALDCVNEQYLLNNPQDNSHLLSLYDDGTNGEADVELSWIDSDSIYTVPEWIAGIRQRISMAFSALGMTRESDFNRNIYLDIVARTSQNVEMEGRKLQLQKEAESLHRRLVVTAILFAMLVGLIIFFAHRQRKKNEYRSKAQQADSKESSSIMADQLRLQAIEDKTEELQENTNLYVLKIDKNKRRNAEKRAKVSLVHAVTPFLDRILNQTDRMNREGKVDVEKLQYIIELTDRIVTYNDILTDWIKMEKGELALQISTIHLDKLFQTLQRGHYAYDQKGVKLVVHPTDLAVKADEALTLFMLNTLADNARKFTPEGGFVTINAEATEKYVELSVQDTGCGIPADDVDKLNNSKVYDARKIGASQEGKGFGFGIMNCRGIIEKYKKTSSLFQICDFHVESEIGVGSRFSFRLPRVLITLVFALISFGLSAENTSAIGRYYEQAYQYNQSEDYEMAISTAQQGLLAIHPHLVLSSLDEELDEEATNEVDLFLKGDSLQYQLAISLRNEVSRAALAMNLWDIYRYNNTICTTLYKLYHQDRSLPTYCEELQQTQTTSRQLLMLLVLFSIALVLLSLLLLRRRLSVGRVLSMQQQLCLQLESLDADLEVKDIVELHTIASHLLETTYRGMSNWHHLNGMQLRLNLEVDSEPHTFISGSPEGELSEYALHDGIGQLLLFGNEVIEDNQLDLTVVQTLSYVLSERVVKIWLAMEEQERQLDELNHLKYEENRLHVQNQVLDNCLSTIKHESMYYPSRIQQLAQRMLQQHSEDLIQLTELSTYYKDIYTLLSNQADKLVQQSSYRNEMVDLQTIINGAVKQINKIFIRKSISLIFECDSIPEMKMRGDTVLLEELFMRFNCTFVEWYTNLHCDFSLLHPNIKVSKITERMTKITYHLDGIILDDVQAHTLFYPESGYIHLLVAKQIVRELDALSNFPGLRLIAEPTENGTDLWFSVLSQST